MRRDREVAVRARYDGHAQWYDDWAAGPGLESMTAGRAALDELVPDGSGPALDLGCGTGLAADVARRHGYQVVGLDYSADQLRLAHARLPVVRADARALPVQSGSAALVYSVFTHTDLDRFDELVTEAVRVLRPGGALVYVGVHPCFVSPFVEQLSDGLRLHPGYRSIGWLASTPFTGDAVRSRVGVHHLPLELLLRAFTDVGARLDMVIERGGRHLPEILAVRLTAHPG